MHDILKKYSSFELVIGLTDGLILLLECLPLDRWPWVRQGYCDQLLILLIKNKKSLTDGLITLMKNETNSIDRYYRY
jgi:hypothetical protein